MTAERLARAVLELHDARSALETFRRAYDDAVARNRETRIEPQHRLLERAKERWDAAVFEHEAALIETVMRAMPRER